MKKKILVPVDGSEHSNKALDHAVIVAEGIGAELILLNVQPSLNTRNVRRFISQSQIEEYQKEMSEEAIQGAIKALKDTTIPYTSIVKIGVADLEICSLASKENVELIIMGSRGLGAVKGKFLGSVSYSVLHQAPCPVTIVP